MDADSDNELPCSSHDPDWSTESFQIPGGQVLQLRVFGFHPLNANLVWPGNARLMEWLDAHAHLLAGKRILELGSATGLLAMFMTMRGWQVTTCDCQADGDMVAANIAHNFSINSLAAPPHIQHDWGTAFPFPDNDASTFPTIVANDILIYVNTYPLLINTLRQLLSCPGSAFYLSWHRRLKNLDQPGQDFFTLLREAGFKADVVGQRIWCITLPGS